MTMTIGLSAYPVRRLCDRPNPPFSLESRNFVIYSTSPPGPFRFPSNGSVRPIRGDLSRRKIRVVSDLTTLPLMCHLASNIKC